MPHRLSCISNLQGKDVIVILMTAADLVTARGESPSATGSAPTLSTALRDIHQRWMRDTVRWPRLPAISSNCWPPGLASSSESPRA
jgi:hypothetical protein